MNALFLTLLTPTSGDRRGSRKPESREKRERVQKIPELADIQSILAAVTKSQTEQTLEPKTMTEIMADDDAAKEKVKAENYKQKKREMAMQVTSDSELILEPL